MNPRLLIAAMVAALAAFVGVVALAWPNEEKGPSGGPDRFEGAVLPKGLKAPDFALRDQAGKRVTMRSLRGEPVVVAFLYSNCEDSCPLEAQQIKGALNELGRDVPALAVSVDPANDTPRSAAAFNSEQRMTGRLTWALGTRAQLAPIWKAYGATPQRDDLEHNARFVLVDPKGVQRVGYPLDKVTPERVAHDLRLLAAGR